MVKNSKIYYANGFKGTISDFAERFNMPYNLLYRRVVSQKWSMEEAINAGKPFISQGYNVERFTINGISGSLPEICKRFNVDYQKVLNKVNQIGKTQENAEKVINKLIREKEIKTSQILEVSKIVSEYKAKETIIKDDKPIVNNSKKFKDVIRDNIENNRLYNPILDICIKNHKDYNIVMYRIANEDMTLEEAMNVPMKIVSTKKLVYKGYIGTMQKICAKYNVDFQECYKMVTEVYDFEYVIDFLKK